MSSPDLDELHQCVEQIIGAITHVRALADRVANAGEAKVTCSALVDLAGVLRATANTVEEDAHRLATAAVAAGEGRADFFFVLD